MKYLLIFHFKIHWITYVPRLYYGSDRYVSYSINLQMEYQLIRLTGWSTRTRLWTCSWDCTTFSRRCLKEETLIHLIYFRACSTFAAVMTIWPTVTEQYLWKSNSYSITTSVKPDCPTAKTGLMGSAAFLSLNSSLFWLLSLMLVKNAREDYLEDVQVVLSNSI